MTRRTLCAVGRSVVGCRACQLRFETRPFRRRVPAPDRFFVRYEFEQSKYGFPKRCFGFCRRVLRVLRALQRDEQIVKFSSLKNAGSVDAAIADWFLTGTDILGFSFLF